MVIKLDDDDAMVTLCNGTVPLDTEIIGSTRGPVYRNKNFILSISHCSSRFKVSYEL